MPSSQTQTTFDQLHELISGYASDVLPLLISGNWNQFLMEGDAAKVAARLRAAALFYCDIKEDVATRLDLAASDIIFRMNGK